MKKFGCLVFLEDSQALLEIASFLYFFQTIRTFSLKGMTSKLFGQETPEQREAKIKILEEQIHDGEEQLKAKNLESR